MLSAIQTLDENVLLWIQDHVRLITFDPLVEFFTTLGNAGIGWIVLSVVLVCKKSTRKAGLLSGLALIFGLFFVNLGLKPLVARPRPYVTMEQLVPLLTSSDPNSFPSGHTCAAFAAGMVWARTLPKGWMRKAAVVQAVLMGLSRLYVGVHYPTDVLAGALAGSLGACLSLIIGRRFWKEPGCTQEASGELHEIQKSMESE